MSIPRITVEELVERLNAKPAGSDKWMARCPAHDDRHESLSISEGPNGLVLLHCFAGCTFEDITRAAGIDPAALMGDAPPRERTPRERARPVRLSKTGANPEHTPERHTELAHALQQVWRADIATTDGGEYLRSRGFDPAALPCVTRYTPDLCGRPAVVWAVRDGAGRTVALHGRHIDGGDPKCHTVGKLSQGVIWVPSRDACRNASELAVTEAALDAMALHLATGKLVVALAGVNPRPWLAQVLQGHRVLLAFDADEGGDNAAAEWADALLACDAEPYRLRPSGVKDWAEMLERQGLDGMRAAMPDAVIIGWPEPEPLADTVEPPPFPLDALPARLREFVQAEAAHAQTPADLPAVVTLCTAAAACARTARIEGAGDWTEPLNLYAVIALPSGSRKSAVISDCTAPIDEVEQSQANVLGPIVRENQLKRQVLTERRDQALKRAEREQDGDKRRNAESEAKQLYEELETLPHERLPRLLCDDATPEALSRLLTEQRGRIACLSAEGGIVFEQAAGLYSDNGAKLEVYLKAHTGDTIRVDRVGRESEYVESPALTLCLCVQPEVLVGAMARRDFRGRGLLARFLWSVPKPTLGYRSLDGQRVPPHVQKAYAACIKALLGRNPSDKPPVIQLGAEAQQVWRGYREKAEKDLRPGERFDWLTDWAAKLPGLVLRLAGVMHLCEHEDAEPVSGETLRAACAIGDYAAEHALIAFGMMGTNPVLAKAEHLLAWVRRNGASEITARDAYRGNRSVFKTPSEAEQALGALVEHGYLRELPGSKGPGRPSPRFKIHPRTRGQNGRKGQNPTADPNIVNCVHSVHGVDTENGDGNAEDEEVF